MPPPNKHLEYSSSRMARDDDDESGNGVGEAGYAFEGEEPSTYMQVRRTFIQCLMCMM